MSIQTGTAGMFGMATQANGLGGSPGTFRWFPYTGLGYGPVQPMQTLPPEAGRTIFTRSNYKTGDWGQGPLSLVPRLDGNFGYLLAWLLGHDRMQATAYPLKGTWAAAGTLTSAAFTPGNVAMNVAGTITFTNADAIFPAGSVIVATSSEDAGNDLTYTVSSTGSNVLNVTPAPASTNADDDSITFQRKIHRMFTKGQTVYATGSAPSASAPTTSAFHTGGTIIFTGAVAAFPAGSMITVANAEDASNDGDYLVVTTTSTDTLNVSPAPAAINADDTTATFSGAPSNNGYHVVTGRTTTALTFGGASLVAATAEDITIIDADSRKEMISSDPVTPGNVALSTAGIITYTGAVAAFPVGSVIEATDAEDADNNQLYTVVGTFSTNRLRVEPKPTDTNADDDTISFRRVYLHNAHRVATTAAPRFHPFCFNYDEADLPYFTTRRVLPYAGHDDQSADYKRGEQVADNHAGSCEISLPAVGPLTANVDLVGRTPTWTVSDIDETWSLETVTFDDDDTYALSCSADSIITLNGVELKATGAVVTVGNNLLTPDQARIIGDYSPVDYPVLSRSAMIRVTAFLEDYELYNKLFTNDASGQGTAWSSTILRGDCRIRASSPATFVESGSGGERTFNYSLEIVNGVDGSSGNVAWGLQNALAIQPQQPIMLTLVGVFEFVDAQTPPFTINFLTDQTSAYA